MEARKVRAVGAGVSILTPGPADLAAVGANMMDPIRREQVRHASLRTSPLSLAALDGRRRPAA